MVRAVAILGNYLLSNHSEDFSVSSFQNLVLHLKRDYSADYYNLWLYKKTT